MSEKPITAGVISADVMKTMNEFCLKNQLDFDDMCEIACQKLDGGEDDVRFARQMLEYVSLWGEAEAMSELASLCEKEGDTQNAQLWREIAMRREGHKCMSCCKAIDPDPQETRQNTSPSRAFLTNTLSDLFAQCFGYCSAECMSKSGLSPLLPFKPWLSDSTRGKCAYSHEVFEACGAWHQRTLVKLVWLVLVAVVLILFLVIWGIVALVF